MDELVIRGFRKEVTAAGMKLIEADRDLQWERKELS